MRRFEVFRRLGIPVCGAVILLAGCQAPASGDAATEGTAAQESASGVVLDSVSGESDGLDRTDLSSSGTTIELAVRDFALRALDATCAGARPFLDLRPGASAVVTDSRDTEVATGTLTQGRAIKATDIDFETAPREPTFCHFTFEVSPALGAGAYTLTAGEGRTASLTITDPADPHRVSIPAVGSAEPWSTPDPSATEVP